MTLIKYFVCVKKNSFVIDKYLSASRNEKLETFTWSTLT